MNFDNNRLASPATITEALLDEALRNPVGQFVDAGGKRIRGALTQIAFEMAGGRGLVAASVSEAIEFLHAGSLVIDDIQDDSRQRRGKPTMHAEIGTPLAINAGNWMYFRALEILATAPFDCEVRSSMTMAMIQTARACHEGQALDLAARVDALPPAQWRGVATRISEQKTGELVRLAMTLGGLAGGGSRSLIAAMDRLGVSIGVTLQMRNDLDELASLAQSDALARADDEIRDDDLRNARVTWPWVWLADVAPDHAQKWSHRRMDSIDPSRVVAQAMLPHIQRVGDAAIGELLDRETRLLGEHVLDLGQSHRLESVLRPIRFGKSSSSRDQEFSHAGNR